MNTFQINLGLNNNPYTSIQVQKYFENRDDYRLMACYVTNKVYKGKIEPTFVAMFENKHNKRQSNILHDFESLCMLMKQETISISTNYMEILAYNPEYKGTPIKFNKKLFEYIKP